MAWESLKNAVLDVIKANGSNQITGPVLQETLVSIINNLGNDCSFVGVATTTTVPSNPDGKVFYLASTVGTYSNFASLTVANGEIAILTNRTGSWTKQVLSITLSDGFVTTDKLADNSVSTSKIIDGAITTNKIAINAITESKIADNQITNKKIQTWVLNNFVFNKGLDFRTGEIEALKVLKNIRIECATANLSDVWVVKAFTKNFTTGFENYIELRNTRTNTGVSRNFSVAELTAGYADISLNSISGYANMFARIWFDYSQTTQTGLLISSSDTSNIAIVPVTVADLTANTANIATNTANIASNTANITANALRINTLNPYVLNRDATFRTGEIEALKVLKNIRIECATANLSDVWVVRAFTKNWTTTGSENLIDLRNTRTGTGVSRNFSVAELTAGYADISLNSISGYANMFARIWFDYSQTTQTGLLISSSDTSNIAIVPVTVADLTANTANIATLQTATTQNTADLSTMKKTTYAVVTGTAASEPGFYFQSTGVWTPYAGYLTILYDVSTITANIYATASKINGTGTALAVYFDASMNRLGMQFQGTTSNVAYTRQLLTRPTNTKYVALCNFSSTEYPYLEQAVQTLVDVVTLEAKVLTAESNIATISSRNQHGGKKIVWLGTSVPFGQNSTKSYAQEAATKLGFTLVNASVPGQAIHADNISGVITPKTYGSTVCSKAEYAAADWTIQSAPVTPYVPGGSYNNYYRTWENIFTPENADASLWVFDVAPNNADFSLTDWNAFNKSAWAYTDGSSFASHRTTFYGAILFLMDKMYALNPNARMVFVLGSDFAYVNGKAAFETIAAQWSIPIIDVWKKINKTSKSLEVIKSLGGTDWHPSTFAHQKLGEIITNELLLIS